MDSSQIFLPMGALAFLTFCVLALIPLARFRAASAKQVTAEDFRYGESGRVPLSTSIPNRNYMNLLEVPVLFYVICLMAFVGDEVSSTFLSVAWVYVGLRAAHSGVHLTINHVMTRLTLFAVSNFVLIALWVLFFSALFSKS